MSEKTRSISRKGPDIDIPFLKVCLLLNGIVPLVLLFSDSLFDGLGTNPVEQFLRTTGVLTLGFLLLTLSVSPLRRVTGFNALIRLRRTAGLFAFFYGVVHLTAYSVFDRNADPYLIAADVWKRPFIALGMAALTLMLPLALTSADTMVKRIGGRNWARLHRLVYLSAALGVAHFYLIQKSDFTYPVIFGIILAFLLGYRIFAGFKRRTRRRG